MCLGLWCALLQEKVVFLFLLLFWVLQKNKIKQQKQPKGKGCLGFAEESKESQLRPIAKARLCAQIKVVHPTLCWERWANVLL